MRLKISENNTKQAKTIQNKPKQPKRRTKLTQNNPKSPKRRGKMTQFDPKEAKTKRNLLFSRNKLSQITKL